MSECTLPADDEGRQLLGVDIGRVVVLECVSGVVASHVLQGQVASRVVARPLGDVIAVWQHGGKCETSGMVAGLGMGVEGVLGVAEIHKK